MSIWDSFNKAIDSAGGALTAAPGVIIDVLKWTPQMAPVLRSRDAAFKFVRNPTLGGFLAGNPVGQAVAAAPKKVQSFLGEEVAEPALEGYNWVRDNVISQPVAAGVRSIQTGEPFIESYLKAENVSPGQQLVAPFGALQRDISYQQAVDDPNQFADEAWFDASSGILDAVASVTLDPTIIGGKAVAVGRAGLLVRPIKPGRIEQALSDNGTNRFVNWVLQNQGKPDVIGQNKGLQRSAAREGIATVLAEAGDEATVRLILRTAAEPPGGPASQLLARERKDLEAIIGRLNNDRNDLLELAYRDAEGNAVRDAYVTELETGIKAELAASESRDRMLEIMEESAGALRKSMPGARGQNWATEKRHKWMTMDVAQRSWFSTPVRTTIRSMQDRRLGVAKYHDHDGGRHVEELLKRVPGLTPEERSQAISRVMGVRSEQEWEDALVAAETLAVRKVAEHHGLTVDTAKEIYGMYANKRRAAFDSFNQRLYSAVKDPKDPTGERTIDVFMDQSTGDWWHAAMLEPQLRNSYALVDIDSINSILKLRAKPIQRAIRHGDAASAAEMMQSAWKISVLFRLGYTLRVLGDDHGRLYAQYGAMAELADLGKGTVNFLRNQKVRLTEAQRRVRAKEPLTRFHGAAPLLDRDLTTPVLKDIPLIGPELSGALVKHFGSETRLMSASVDELQKVPGIGPVIAEQIVNAISKAKPKLARRVGESLTVHGIRVPGAFEGEASIFRELAGSTGGDWVDFIRSPEMANLAAVRKLAQTGGWETIVYDVANKSTHARYFAAWQQAINDQLANSQIARRLMEGQTPEQVTKWLSGTGGKSLRKRIPTWGHDPEDWVNRVAMMVDSYVPEVLRKDALKSAVTKESLQNVIAKPPVHGGQLMYNLGDHGINSLIDKTIQKSMRFLNGLPTDILSRQPGFARAYKQIMSDLVDDAKRLEIDLTDETLNSFARMARKQSLKETKELLFDISSKSQWAHAVRFLAPFAGAWQDTLAVWLKLSAQNPHRIARLGIAFDAPARGGLYVDEHGQPIEPKGIGLPGEDEFIQFRLPKWAQRNIPGLKSMETVTVSEKSLNLVLQGDPVWLPGAGPFVQIPVNEILLRTRPEYAEAVPFILPFGVQYPGDNPVMRAVNLLTPAAFRKALAADPESALDPNTAVRIWQGEFVRWQNGERDDAPTWAEVEKKARSFNAMKAVFGFVQPGQVAFHPHGKFYVDEWRRLLNENAGNKAEAEKQFFEKYGAEFWPFIASVSKNNTGIPATVNAMKASRKYSSLIAAHPEFGGLIIGPEGAGSFSSNAYNWQLSSPTGPGSDTTFREKQSPQESIEKAQVDTGWLEYQKTMDMLDALLFERGLTSYQQKGADDLQAWRQQITQQLGEQNRLWYRDYQQRDSGLVADRIEALRTLSQAPELAENPLRSDIRTLQTYFQSRDMLVAELQRRKEAGDAGTLQAQANADIAQYWAHIQGVLVERDPMFAGLFHRYLESDNLQYDPILSE